jgi:hypothetical protein
MKASKRASHAQQREDVLVLEADGAHARNAELQAFRERAKKGG